MQRIAIKQLSIKVLIGSSNEFKTRYHPAMIEKTRNPNIITDKDGKASFEYFNADTRGIYRIVVEGIDGDGNIGRQVYKYEVK